MNLASNDVVSQPREVKGIIIAGNSEKIFIRKKSSAEIALGELLIAYTENNDKILLQVVDLVYSSQLSQQNLELISGYKLEENQSITFFEEHLRHYIIAVAKPLVVIKQRNNTIFTEPCKILPKFMSEVYSINSDDLDFRPNNPLYVGKLRSGSRSLPKPVFLDGKKVLSHHILISAQTGKGKSNLVKDIILESLNIDYVSFLVFDPHDEYYRNGFYKLGIKTKKLKYYSKDPLDGTSLLVSLKLLLPSHIADVVEFSSPQLQLMSLYYSKYKENWIKAILFGYELGGVGVQSETLDAVKRRIMSVLELSISNGKIISNSIFSENGSDNILNSIINDLETSHVIIDTSRLSDKTEQLISMMIARQLFNLKKRGKFDRLVSIVIEEAPRVLSDEDNIFSVIAREGRKFNIGLIAITQLPSLIPRQVLANLNTKIILGTEMASERRALIDSAAQDLSDFSRAIASLNKGEAIVTTTFTNFPVPIKADLFEEKAKKYKERFLEDKHKATKLKLSV